MGNNTQDDDQDIDQKKLDDQDDDADDDSDDDDDDSKKNLDDEEDDSSDDDSDDDSNDSDDDNKGKKKSDPLDEITDPEELRKRAKKYRGMAGRKDRQSHKDDQPRKQEKKPEAKPQQQALTPEDVLAFTNAKVTHKEDIEYVRKVARVEGVSIEKALEDSMVTDHLTRQAEFRRTADATNTGKARRGNNRPSSDQVIENAGKGKMPEDPEELANARAEQRRKSHKK